MAQKLQKSSDREEFKRIILRGVLYVVVIPVVVIAVIVGGIYLKSAIEASNAQASMKEYLQKKYNREFVVENYRVEGAGLAVEGDPRADAHPKDDRSLKFIVADVGSRQVGSHSYWDSYPEQVWKREASEELRDMLVSAFDDDIRLKSVELSSISASRDIRGEVPRYDVAFKKYGKEIYMMISIEGAKTYDKLPERLHKVISGLKSLGVSLHLNYKDTQYKIQLNRTATENIASAEDINKYIEGAMK